MQEKMCTNFVTHYKEIKYTSKMIFVATRHIILISKSSLSIFLVYECFQNFKIHFSINRQKYTRLVNFSEIVRPANAFTTDQIELANALFRILMASESNVTKSDLHKKFDCDSQIQLFRFNGRLCVEYIIDCMEHIEGRNTISKVQPGFLEHLIPNNPPNEPDEFKNMLRDFHKYVMPGMAQWTHPQFNAYYPTGSSFSNVLAEMLSTSIGGVGFTWTSQPSLTEVENVMMDWLARALNLPSAFIFEDSRGVGAGCIENSASDSIFSTMISARHIVLVEKGCYPLPTLSDITPQGKQPSEFLPSLIGYASSEVHCSFSKAAHISMCAIRLLKPNESGAVTGEILEKAIKEDLSKELIPFYFCATLGTTDACYFDDLRTIGPICKHYNLWLHVDAAYAGCALICPEYRSIGIGLEFADSISINPYKFMLATFDSSCLWLRNVEDFKAPYLIDATYLIDEYADDDSREIKMNTIDYRHYGLPLSRRMRGLKLWFLLRMYGVEGLQNYIRKSCRLAKYFQHLLEKDDRFEVCNDVKLALVCFRQKL